jgi:lysophospholipase L1-like esterase
MNVKILINGVALAFGLMIAVSMSACDSGSGSGDSKQDFGDNDPNKVVALGDSITEGICAGDGAPYPSRLAGLSGKNVINQGSCGERSSGGASRIGGILNKQKPGYIVILYGANDAIFGYSTEQVVGNLRNMCNAAIANKTVPVLMTCTPMYDSHAFANGRVLSYNPDIRALAKELKIKLVDLEKEFGTERSFLQSDGLHPSDSGNQVIAMAVNDRI